MWQEKGLPEVMKLMNSRLQIFFFWGGGGQEGMFAFLSSNWDLGLCLGLGLGTGMGTREWGMGNGKMGNREYPSPRR